ncbi:MAG: VOC family protein [Calditrichaeota bacterium]|nr:VOC family protein [Calditrichota bacterium]
MSTPIGAICHLELFVSSLDKSPKFYESLFGWKTSGHDSGYLFWEDTDGFTGGFTTAGGPVINPAATFYIRVDNISEMLKKIARKGGTIIREKTEIGGDNGCYALFRDLSGNNVGLWAAD